VGQKFEKNFEFLTISSLYVRYISATAKNRRLQAAYVAFYPSCRNPVKSVHRGKASRLAKGFLQGGPKNSKKIRIFDHLQTLRISATLKIRAIQAAYVPF